MLKEHEELDMSDRPEESSEIEQAAEGSRVGVDPLVSRAEKEQRPLDRLVIAYDAGWNAVMRDENLSDIRRRLSIHDMKQLVGAVTNAVLTPPASPPLQPTEAMIDSGAQRIVSWEDDSVWPDSWDAATVVKCRILAERVWRSMWLDAL